MRPASPDCVLYLLGATYYELARAPISCNTHIFKQRTCFTQRNLSMHFKLFVHTQHHNTWVPMSNKPWNKSGTNFTTPQYLTGNLANQAGTSSFSTGSKVYICTSTTPQTNQLTKEKTQTKAAAIFLPFP